MNLRAYPRLSTGSRRAMTRTKKSFGRSYQYQPRANLLNRLSRELGISFEGAYQLLQVEREYLINQQKLIVR